MKKLLISLVVILNFGLSYIRAQDLKLNSYTFGEGIEISGNENSSMKLGGFVQPSFESKLFTDPTRPDAYNRFRMRRLRLRLSGDAAWNKVDYSLQLDLSGTSETGDASSSILLDAWVAYNLNKQIQITFGQRSSPTDNRELTMGSQTLQLVERSRLTTAFSTIREFGLFIDGTFKTGGETYLKPYLTITNGDGLNVMLKDHGGLKFGGRVDFLPFGLFRNFGQFRQADVVRELTPKLVVGGNFSYNVGVSSRNGKESGTILYLDNLQRELLPNYTKYGVDFLFKYRGFSMIGEFVGTAASVPTDIFYRVRNDGSTATTFIDIDGVQNVANYVKERMILGKGYNIQAGYVFRNHISIDARYSHIEADKYSFLNNGTFYNRPNYYTVGVSKYFSRGYGFKVQGSVTYTTLNAGSNDLSGLPITGNELTFNVLTSIAF
jgi:hypothetical protein